MKTEITGENAAKFWYSRKFQDWLNSFDPKLRITSIEEGWSFWKGEKQNELVFALLFVRYLDERGVQRGEVVFFRSNASAVFLVLRDKDSGQKYVVLVEQLRIASGGKLLEIPAGSVEENDNSLTTIVREVQEEVGLLIPADNFEFMGERFSSPGACNEKIALYYCEVVITGAEIKKLQDKLTGTLGENTKVKIYSLEVFDGLKIKDDKTQLAYELYLKRKARK